MLPITELSALYKVHYLVVSPHYTFQVDLSTSTLVTSINVFHSHAQLESPTLRLLRPPF